MFSGSQVLSVFPLWDPYRISCCPLSVLSDYSVACCCSMHFSPIWKQGAKAFSFEDSVLLGKEIFPNSPSPISPYISLEGTGSNRRLGSQAKENGVGSAWAGHIVSPNKMRALWGRKQLGNEWLFSCRNSCLPHVVKPELFVRLYKECTPETSPVSALCLSWWKFSPVILLNKLCGLLNWVKISSLSLCLD